MVAHQLYCRVVQGDKIQPIIIKWPCITTTQNNIRCSLYLFSVQEKDLPTKIIKLSDPATFLTSNSALGPYFPRRVACLLSYGKGKYF